MAVTVVHLLTENDSVDRSTYTTSAVTIPGGQVSLLAIDRAGATTVAPTPTQTGVTWSPVTSVSDFAWLFRAAPATNQTGTISIAWGETKTGCGWSIDTCVDSIPTANGADALGSPVVQTIATDTAATVTLAALANAGSAAIGFVRLSGTTTAVTVGSGFTLLGDASRSTPMGRLASEWRQNVTVVDWTFASSSRCMIGVEVKAAADTSRFFALL